MKIKLWKLHTPGHNHGNDIFLGTVEIHVHDAHALPGFVRVLEGGSEIVEPTVRNFKHIDPSIRPDTYVEMLPDEPVGKNLVTVSVDTITRPGSYGRGSQT